MIAAAALVAVGLLAPAAGVPATAAPRDTASIGPAIIESAESAPASGVTATATSPPGWDGSSAQLVLYASNAATCPEATSGPTVRRVGYGTATMAGGKAHFLVPPPIDLQAGDWIYATADSGEPITSVGPCVKVRAGDLTAVTATGASAQSVTVHWKPMPDATGYVVTLAHRVTGHPVRTAEVGDVTSLTVSGLPTGSLYQPHVQAITPSGLGQAAFAQDLTALPFPTTAALADRQIRDFTGRASTATERHDWWYDLHDGIPSVAGKIDQQIDTPAWGGIQGPVIRLFQASFGRLPDTGGLAYWSNRRRAGTSIRMTATVFTQSSEFQARYGDLSNRDFVTRIYLNVLGRSADSGGSSYWTRRLDHHVISRGELVVQFSEGSEHVAETAPTIGIVNVYTAMLRRMPTSAELTTWAPATGAPPRIDAVRSILGSAAYGTRIGATS